MIETKAVVNDTHNNSYHTFTCSLSSDWPKAYSEFSKSAPGTSSSGRLCNNHVNDTQGNGSHVMYDCGA